MRVRNFCFAVKFGLFAPNLTAAHVSEQGFVLLLPTGAYTAAGVAVVVLTILALLFLPDDGMRRMFRPKPLNAPAYRLMARRLSLGSFAVMLGLVWLGWNGR